MEQPLPLNALPTVARKLMDFDERLSVFSDSEIAVAGYSEDLGDQEAIQPRIDAVADGKLSSETALLLLERLRQMPEEIVCLARKLRHS